MKAISIRQPWAWAIVAGHKPIENRTWKTSFRGRVLIHAGRAAVSGADLEELARHARRQGFPMPEADRLFRGGIVGSIEIIDVVTTSSDPWFKGPFGWILEEPRPARFRSCAGRLRLFRVDGPP